MVAVLNSSYDFAESTTDDYTDCHVYYIAFDGKFLEFRKEFHNYVYLFRRCVVAGRYAEK